MISRLRQLAWHWRHWRDLQRLQCEAVLLHERLKRVEKVLGIDSSDARFIDELYANTGGKRNN